LAHSFGCAWREIGALTAEKKTAEILIDSGSEVTVCPKKFADELGTSRSSSSLRLRAVDGGSIQHHGQRKAPLELETSEGKQNASMTFQGWCGATRCFVMRVGRQGF
jgi:hypothetical protein